MSFSSEQKKLIIEHIYKPCCRRNLLYGVLFSKATVDNGVVRLSVEKKDFAGYIAKLIKEFYGKQANILPPSKGGRYVLVQFDSNSVSDYISNISDKKPDITKKCEACISSFLRGIFLACGRFSDPDKQYSLEFTLPKERINAFLDILSEFGITPGVTTGKREPVAYLRRCEDIEDFCGYAGLNKAMFKLIDAKAEGELRKNVMRVANCETNNITKAVNAASAQLEVIYALEKANLLSTLPEELEATARLRIKYADLSLSQLAAVSVPPISKPGLSHRLKKIIEIGERLLNKQ